MKYGSHKWSKNLVTNNLPITRFICNNCKIECYILGDQPNITHWRALTAYWSSTLPPLSCEEFKMEEALG